MSIYIYQVNLRTEYNLKIFTHKWYLNIYINTIGFRFSVISEFVLYQNSMYF